MATTPTLEQYLAGKQAVFKPTQLAATPDSVIGSGDSGQFVPGNVARDSTFDTDQATSDYYKQLAALEWDGKAATGTQAEVKAE